MTYIRTIMKRFLVSSFVLPPTNDFVWHIPLSFGGSRDDADLKAEMEATGDSDRMALLFQKKS